MTDCDRPASRREWDHSVKGMLPWVVIFGFACGTAIYMHATIEFNANMQHTMKQVLSNQDDGLESLETVLRNQEEILRNHQIIMRNQQSFLRKAAGNMPEDE